MKKGKPKTFDGRLNIGYVHGSDSYVRITVTDKASRGLIVELGVPWVEWAKAIGNQGNQGEQPCFGELFDAFNLVGCTAENKTENVFVPRELLQQRPDKTMPAFHRMPDQMRMKYERNWATGVLREQEVDGWRSRSGDLFNSHNRQHSIGDDGEVYKVVFFRHVRPDGTPVLEDEDA